MNEDLSFKIFQGLMIAFIVIVVLAFTILITIDRQQDKYEKQICTMKTGIYKRGICYKSTSIYE
jgi:signal transduction histidine kinase